MVRMIAIRNFPYQGKYLKKGDTFEARDKTHARQLRSASFAADAVRRGRPPKSEGAAEAIKEVAEVVHDAVDAVASKKKAKADTYQTRALSAED